MLTGTKALPNNELLNLIFLSSSENNSQHGKKISSEIQRTDLHFSYFLNFSSNKGDTEGTQKHPGRGCRNNMAPLLEDFFYMAYMQCFHLTQAQKGLGPLHLPIKLVCHGSIAILNSILNKSIFFLTVLSFYVSK